MKKLFKCIVITAFLIILNNQSASAFQASERNLLSNSYLNINSGSAKDNNSQKENLKGFRDENGKLLIADDDDPTQPESDAMSERFLNSYGVGDLFGLSVASAGDVNADGYDDIIVGAYLNDGSFSNAGRAYIYYGGLIFNSTPDVILSGDSANSYFGASVSTAGDVNGDGYDDVIVGAYQAGSAKGKAFLYLGGSVMNNVSDLTFTGETTSSSFGTSVATAGDVNGDGFSDIIIGAPGYNSNSGRSYIYLGGVLLNNVTDLTLTNSTTGTFFGYSVSSAGDMNGDGFSDVIVGSYGYTSSTGRAFVYLGGAILNSGIDLTLTGETTSSSFGTSVSKAGDINGDGYSDIIVGAPNINTFTGKVYVYYGNSVIDNTADFTFSGEATGSYFGISVANAGDIDGDSYSDLIIGASNKVKAYVFRGGPGMDNIPDKIFNGEDIGDRFGYSVSSAGDINGDGISDLIVGDYLNDNNGNNSGRAYVYINSNTGNDIEDITFINPTGITNEAFGFQVASAGDVNGDGYKDIIVGAAFATVNDTGKAYIYYGGVYTDGTPDVTLKGEVSSSSFGYSVSGAGDINGDGYDDVIVGAYNYNASTGRVYIYKGGASMDNIADGRMTGESTLSSFGYSVSEAGDVNADGYSDFLIGAYGYSTSTGRAYLFLGSSNLDTNKDNTLAGSIANNDFGYSVSSAGDVNGDGYSDILIGSPGFNS
ncbi:MAG: integrin alpha, partial [Ignavibacteria bacterium]|nr:integrin alpha [Ignavibacteria bacterium]